MSAGGPFSERALVLASPSGEGQETLESLRAAGLVAQIHENLADLCGALEIGGAVLVMAEEATVAAELDTLTRYLARQPPWSDLPVILITGRGGGPERNPAATRLGEVLGNVSFLERPFHPTTLASLVRAAVRGRRRQYDDRARLEELGASEQRLRAALRAGRRGAWSLDVATMALVASDECAAHYGRSSGPELTYAEFLDGLHPDDKARQQAAARRSIDTGEDYVVDYRFIWPDGGVHWIDVRAGAIRDVSGRVTQLVGVSADITARKTLEGDRERLIADLAQERMALSELTRTLEARVAERTAELAAEVKAREEAQDKLLQSQKMESLGQLTGGVAHDFNNLLMAVMSNLELLRKHVVGDARAERLIAGAIQGAERGASLTTRMLAFARQQDLKTCSADLAALVTGMRELLERSLGPGITLAIEAPVGIGAARVDANQFELAILNLVINARDAIPDGGTIAVTVRRRDLEEGAGPPRPFVEVEVKDTGVGMDAATLRKSIDPFFTTKPIGKGTGLGLSMVHGLARQLGGFSRAVQRAGAGEPPLPCGCRSPKPPRPCRSPKRRPWRADAPRPATILVVDDDALIAMSTVDMLEDLGHTVLEAHSGREALEILRSGTAVDLMMTDQAMPGMTGVELARIVRDERPELPVLLATGYAELPSEAGIDLPRLAKPYQQAQLRKEIERLIGRSQVQTA